MPRNAFFQSLKPDAERVGESRFLGKDAFETRSAVSFNSGYASCIRSRTAKTISCRNGFVCPSNRPCVIARRMILRSTYPRPSFDGSTPSEIRNVAAREWSAITRNEAADFVWQASLCQLLSRVCTTARARQLRRSLDQRRKQIRLVIRNHALQHRRHALQPHPRINRRLGQRIQLARWHRGQTA